MKWQDIVKLSDSDLEAKGVAALGARRKMLKVFENIRAECDENVSQCSFSLPQWTDRTFHRTSTTEHTLVYL